MQRIVYLFLAFALDQTKEVTTDGLLECLEDLFGFGIDQRREPFDDVLVMIVFEELRDDGSFGDEMEGCLDQSIGGDERGMIIDQAIFIDV